MDLFAVTSALNTGFFDTQIEILKKNILLPNISNFFVAKIALNILKFHWTNNEKFRHGSGA